MQLVVVNSSQDYPRNYMSAEEIMDAAHWSRSKTYRVMSQIPEEYKIRVLAYDRKCATTMAYLPAVYTWISKQRDPGNPLFRDSEFQARMRARR